jgi:hypothetical protein
MFFGASRFAGHAREVEGVRGDELREEVARLVGELATTLTLRWAEAIRDRFSCWRLDKAARGGGF